MLPFKMGLLPLHVVVSVVGNPHAEAQTGACPQLSLTIPTAENFTKVSEPRPQPVVYRKQVGVWRTSMCPSPPPQMGRVPTWPGHPLSSEIWPSLRSESPSCFVCLDPTLLDSIRIRLSTPILSLREATSQYPWFCFGRFASVRLS